MYRPAISIIGLCASEAHFNQVSLTKYDQHQ